MKITSYILCLLFVLGVVGKMNAQHQLSLTIVDKELKDPVVGAQLFIFPGNMEFTSDENGTIAVNSLKEGSYEFIFFADAYQNLQTKVEIKGDSQNLKIELEGTDYELTEVLIQEKRAELFALRRMKEVEGTAIFAGKKNEVVVMDQLTVNLAANNSRQIYSQVTGLNIYETNDAGLQLNVGGRGLNPNRTANFNTRQNGYDISADVLGYPESYYTPPAEALSEIQVIRGAASLQYGTQFGGLINFKFKEHISDKKASLISRQSLGSFGLFTSFNRLSGTVGKFSYAGFFNYKRGDGFRPNSGFESQNAFIDLHFKPAKNTFIDLEYTYLNYLAQQPGGVTDAQFYRDPTFSNRERNWFSVNWRLTSLRLEQILNDKSELSLNLFALDASRKALGFRTNRVSQTDDPNEARDLILGDFNNWGAEARYVNRYQLLGTESIFLIGAKYYQSNNFSVQGPGSNGFDANFNLASEEFPFYPNQSSFQFPNLNFALFGEHIFHLGDKWTVTPGARFEYIRTESEGSYKRIDFDLAGNPIRDTSFADNRILDRHFLLFGLGVSYKSKKKMEIFANFSQNYRSVTFSDIRIVNPSFQVDPNISDESGFTLDGGIRGRIKSILSYDIGAFAIKYNNRIGEVLRAQTTQRADGSIVETGRVVRFRGNIGNAFIYGMEGLVDWNIAKTFSGNTAQWKLNAFVNSSVIGSQYIESEIPGVKGNQVEFIPSLNLKTGLSFGWKNFLGNLQYTYLSQQYTDASNAEQDIRDNQSGIVGAIPAYDIVDLSLSYSWKWLKFEGGINNLLNNAYFTHRATGYPGPGIIPSAPRTWYLTAQIKLE
ncbi:MAG: TonB-dependent receptor [Bacteroidia bacterium]|nr:TonB-dependent receptor [Bacteroidia bacterium]